MNVAPVAVQFLCGTCAGKARATLTDAGSIGFGTACETCGAAATGVYARVAKVDTAAPTERPRLELVKLTPPTLDPATHAKQALDLLAAWTSGREEAAGQADAWMAERAVDVVAKIHELVHNRK